MAEKKDSDRVEIDFGVGKVSFGGVFKGLGNLIDLVARLSEEGVEKKGEVKGLPRGARGVYGFSIRTLAGKPVVESFGNIRETARGPVVGEVREPIVDVFDEKDRILVIAELPGVSESAIKIELAGDILNLTATDKGRKYAKEILLPSRVKPDPVRTSYKNGILEITLEKDNNSHS